MYQDGRGVAVVVLQAACMCQTRRHAGDSLVGVVCSHACKQLLCPGVSARLQRRKAGRRRLNGTDARVAVDRKLGAVLGQAPVLGIHPPQQDLCRVWQTRCVRRVSQSSHPTAPRARNVAAARCAHNEGPLLAVTPSCCRKKDVGSCCRSQGVRWLHPLAHVSGGGEVGGGVPVLSGTCSEDNVGVSRSLLMLNVWA